MRGDTTCDVQFEVLTKQERRQILLELYNTPSNSSIALLDVEAEDTVSEAERLSLVHCHLPKLEQAGFVESTDNFEVKKGEFIAFVGESGAGKSTIASLLARLYTPDSGRILAAGRPVSEYDIDEWRSRVAYVRQDPFIFNTTLEGNLRIANPDATRRELERVCEIAQVTEFVDDLPNGYDSELGDDGVRLSGGQRQRVALARALLEDADILILDEATSDLDTNIEARVQAGIESMDRDFMTLAIAHRLSTISDADRIYTVQDGTIVEQGEHESLLSRDGQYAELYSAQ